MGLQSSEKTTWYNWNHENWIYFSINPGILQGYWDPDNCEPAVFCKQLFSFVVKYDML